MIQLKVPVTKGLEIKIENEKSLARKKGTK